MQVVKRFLCDLGKIYKIIKTEVFLTNLPPPLPNTFLQKKNKKKTTKKQPTKQQQKKPYLALISADWINA